MTEQPPTAPSSVILAGCLRVAPEDRDNLVESSRAQLDAFRGSGPDDGQMSQILAFEVNDL